MAYIVTKTIKGRQYRYLQRTYRDGSRVRTECVYLGPVDGPSRRKGLLRRVGEFIAVNLQHDDPGAAAMARALLADQAAQELRDAANDKVLADLYSHYGLRLGPDTPAPIRKGTSSAVGLENAPCAASHLAQENAPSDSTDGAGS